MAPILPMVDPLAELDSLTGVSNSNDDNEFGMANGYTSRHLHLAGQQSAAQENAINYLREALNNQAEITPAQGIAAALLSAIPTLGGYMIGKSIGKPNIPEGTYFHGMSGEDFTNTFRGGELAMGEAGAKIGNESSQSYLGGLIKEDQAKTPILEKMAAVEQQRAQQLASQDEQIIAAGLGQQEQNQRQEDAQAHDREMVGLQENARQRGGELDPIIAQRLVADLGLPPDTRIDATDAKLLNDAAEAKRRQERQSQTFGGEMALKPPPSVAEKLGSADAIVVAQERLRNLYNVATKQLGPGFAQAFARKGIAAFPANAQAEFLGTLKGVAMEMNKVVDPTPSDVGMKAQYEKLLAAVETGHFFDAFDFEVKNARNKALAALTPYTLGDYPNAQAVSLKKQYEQRWGVAPQMSKAEMQQRINELLAKAGR